MKIAANISLLFKELPLLERFDAARQAGFDGIEIQFPYAETAEALRRAAATAALPVVLINAPVIPGSHPMGCAARPELRREFRAQLPQLKEYAEALGARFVHVLAGRCANALERDRYEDAYVENLLLAAQTLGARAQVLIEVLNALDVPGYFLDGFNRAQAVIARCAGAIALQFDVYHAARMDLSPSLELSRLLPLVKHVQIADAPGRHEPGSGNIDFKSIRETLRGGEYSGWLGAEYQPQGSTASGLGWLAQWRRAEGLKAEASWDARA